MLDWGVACMPACVIVFANNIAYRLPILHVRIGVARCVLGCCNSFRIGFGTRFRFVAFEIVCANGHFDLCSFAAPRVWHLVF